LKHLPIGPLSKISPDLLLSLTCLLLSIISLLFNITSSTVVLLGGYDTELYIKMARSLAVGEWLGPYDYMTLVRLPLYPAILAVSSILDFRLPVFQHGLLIVGFLLLVGSLRENQVSRRNCLFIFVLLAFNPLTLFLPQLVITETLVVAILSAVVAGCLGVYANLQGNLYRFIFWLAALVIGVGLYVQVRAEGMWILGLFLMLLLMLLIRHQKQSLSIRFILILILPLLCMNLIENYISTLNERTYGIHATSDLVEENFSTAMKWMTKVSPENHRRQVPVTSAAFTEIYKVSPSFSELKDTLDFQLNQGPWLMSGCSWMNVCDELSGGWTVWAIREAAHLAGFHQTGLQASQFYAAIAAEIQQGCENDLISCTSNSTGSLVAPPLKVQFLPAIILSGFKWIGNFLRLDGLSIVLEAVVATPVSDELVACFDIVTHDQAGIEPNTNSANYQTYFNLFVLFQLASVLVLFPYFIARLRSRLKGVTIPKFLEMVNTEWIFIFAIAGVLGRSMVVGYVDVMSFDAQVRYIFIIYPLAMVVFGLYLPGSIFWLSKLPAQVLRK